MQFHSSSVYAFTVLHPFILSPFRLLTPQLPAHISRAWGDGSSHLLLKKLLSSPYFPGCRLRCLLDSHLTPWPVQERCVCVWVVANRQLYNPFHQVWGGMKPQLMKPSPSYANLEKHTSSFICTLREKLLGKQKAGWRHLLICNGSSETVAPAKDVKAKVRFSVKVAPRDSETCSNFLASGLENRCAQGCHLC